MFEDADLIHRYTRAQALEDGVLVDVSETAKDAGFRVPVAVTQTAWADCVHWIEEDSARIVHQDESGRLWDVLWMAYVAARVNQNKSELLYRLTLTRTEGRETVKGYRNVLVRDLVLKLHIGPGDDGEMVFTIMLPQES